MDMFFTVVGMFIFCTRRCTRVRLNARHVGEAFRYYSNALSLEVLAFQVLYFIAPYNVLLILDPTPFCVDILA